MRTRTTPARRSRRRRSPHTDEELLDLVRRVATRAAMTAPMRFVLPGEVSMAAFNAARGAVDRERGVEPTGPQRTPSAEEVRRRFCAAANRPLSWRDIVEGALRDDRQAWLHALTRRTAAAVTDEQVRFGLRYVAHELDTDSLDRTAYRQTRERLLAEDRKRWGEEGMLDGLLPTVEQLDGQLGWSEALKLARLTDRESRERQRAALIHQTAGLPLPEAAAHYAAVNHAWPSFRVLRHWATDCGFALAHDKNARWHEVLDTARALLVAIGLPAPTATPKSGGRGQRLTYRYPVNGVLGAPPPSHISRSRHDGDERKQRLRALCVLALRHFLTASADDTRSAYVAWQPGTGWPSASTMSRHGGFAALREEARDANRRDEREHGVPVPEATRRLAAELRDVVAGASAVQVVPFTEAVQSVIAGPHAVGPRCATTGRSEGAAA